MIIFEFDAVTRAIDFLFCAEDEIARFGIICLFGAKNRHTRHVEVAAKFFLQSVLTCSE